MSITIFQARALLLIKALGGSIYYGTDDKSKAMWTDKDGARISILNADDRTFGIVGEPTIQALIHAKKIKHDQGSKFVVVG